MCDGCQNSQAPVRIQRKKKRKISIHMLKIKINFSSDDIQPKTKIKKKGTKKLPKMCFVSQKKMRCMCRANLPRSLMKNKIQIIQSKTIDE